MAANFNGLLQQNKAINLELGRSRPITYVQNWINYVLNRIGPAPIIITSLWMLNAWQSARNSMAYLFGAGNNSKWPLPCQVTTGPVDICWNKVVMACRHMVRSCALWDQTKGIYLFQFYSHTKYNRFSAKKKTDSHSKNSILFNVSLLTKMKFTTRAEGEY